MKCSAVIAAALSRIVGSLIATLVVVAPPTWAGVTEDNDICFQASGDTAIAACDRVINSAQATRKQLVDAYLNRGQEYYQKKDNDRAIADFEKAISLNPSFAMAYVNRGNVKSRMKQIDAAIADYAKAISLDPAYTAAYTGRGLAYENKGENARAIADYKKAISVSQKYQDGKWAHEKAHERLKVLGGN